MKLAIEAMFESYPRFSECTIQTFDDNKERKASYLAKLFENKEDIYPSLEKLNSDGAGIFFSVNPMLPWKRDKSSVVGVSSWICEIDWIDKDLQKKLIDICPLKPNMILESKSSYHMYWFADDWTIENWSVICNWLRNFFDWDPAIPNDISRVLRLPWYYHMKDANNPFLIDLLEFVPWKYTEKQMLDAYPNTKQVSEIKQSVLQKEFIARDSLWWEYYWDRVKNMDTKTMLQEISGSEWVSWESIDFVKNNNGTEQIIVNGKSTGAWIDKNWKIGSTSGWWPNRTNWVFWYGKCDWKELARWINDKHPEMVIKKTIPKKETKFIVEDNDVDWSAITPFSRWLPSVDKKFWRFERNKLIVTIWESQSWKTEYTFFQARVNANRWYKVCYIALEMNKKNMILRICQKLAWVSKADWDDKKFTESQKLKMKQKYDELWNYKNLDITYLSKPTLEEIKETITEKQKQWYELFYIDNLWFIKDPDIEEIEYVPLVVRELKDITNTQPVSINLLHHFNKWWSRDRVWPRWMASIRSSGKIENDADYIFQVWRDLDDDIPQEEKRNVLLYLQKDRVRWDPSSVQVLFDYWDYKDIEKKEDPF